MYGIYTTEIFDDWFLKLKDKQVKARIQARIDRIEDGNLGDVSSVGEGVFELRFFFASGFRVYCCKKDQYIIVLLAGGDKSTQIKDIKQAIRLAKALEDKF